MKTARFTFVADKDGGIFTGCPVNIKFYLDGEEIPERIRRLAIDGDTVYMTCGMPCSDKLTSFCVGHRLPAFNSPEATFTFSGEISSFGNNILVIMT